MNRGYGVQGEFQYVPAREGAHGPVKVHNTHHFAYADGRTYYPFGTTCYAWTHQGDALEEQTLKTLEGASFNKIRMCVFPKDYPFNKNEPVYYPFERDEAGESDFTRFNPAFFQHFEQRFSGGRNGDYQLVYLENYQPNFLPVWLPQADYQIDLIDPWEMTISPAKVKQLSEPPSYSYDMPGAVAPTYEIELPNKPRMAIRITKK